MIFKGRSLERVDSFIIVVCILCAFASSGWLFYDIVFSQVDIKGSVPIGKISDVQNHVKRKFNKSMIWYDASQKETVYENDWIFTGSNSKTTIVLNEGGELSIDPDSLIVLSRKNGVLKLNLQHGSMIANVSKDIEVNVVRNGKLEKVGLKERTQLISQKKIVKKPKLKKVIQKKIEIALQSPADFETIWVDESKEVRLSWDNSANINNYNLELSRTKNFANSTSKTFSSNQAKVKIPTSGKYYWRVSDSQNPKSQSAINSFEAKVNTPPLSALNFSEGETLELTSKDGVISPAPLGWTDSFNSWDNYDVQISKTSTFDKILEEGSSQETLYNFKPTQGGQYFWRIRGRDKAGTVISAWSAPEELNISIKENAKKEIQLARTTIKVNLSPSDLKNIKPDRTVDLSKTNKNISIRWQTSYPAPSYRIQISNNTDFTNNYEDVISKKKNKIFKSAFLGTSYYRVIVEDRSGKTNFTSRVGKIITHIPSPSSLNNSMEENSNTMTWDPIPGIETYEVSYIDKEGGMPKTKYVSANEFTIGNDHKYLKWKVRAVETASKTPLSDYTKMDIWRKLEEPTKELASVAPTPGGGTLFPILTSPSKRKTFVAVGQSEIFFVMKWDYSKKVDFYDVEISKTKDMGDVVYKKKVRKKRRAAVKQVFAPGVYYMRVRAIKTGAPTAWSDIEIFRVQGNKN